MDGFVQKGIAVALAALLCAASLPRNSDAAVPAPKQNADSHGYFMEQALMPGDNWFVRFILKPIFASKRRQEIIGRDADNRSDSPLISAGKSATSGRDTIEREA